MTPQQREALKQALDQHSLKMAVKDAAPEDVAALPQDFAVPSYNENNKPLYDNQLFPAVNSVDDLIARGYATPDGQVTENGQMALSLKKVGALNDDYTLNDTGKAMMASREDLLQPENLNLYAKAKDLKLDDGDDLTFSQNVAELWGKAKDLSRAVENEIDPYSGAIKAIGSFVTGPIPSVQTVAGIAEQISEGLPSKEQRAAATIRRQTAVDEFSEQGVQTLMGAGELMLKGALNAPVTTPFGITPEFLEEATKDQAILAANQNRERINNEVQKVSSAEAIDDFTGFTNFVGAYQEAENLLGQEKTQEAIKEGEALGLAASIINPAAPEAIAFGVGLKAAGRVAAPFSGAMFRAERKAAQVLNGTKTLASLQKQAADYQLVVGAAEKRAIQAEQTADKLSRAGFVDRANNTRLAANKIRMQGQEAGQKLGSLQDEVARVSDDLSVLSMDATVADKVFQLTQKAKDLPFQSISGLGKAIEYTGRGMIGIDKGLSNLAAKVGVDKAYNAMNKVTTLSGLGTVASAAGLGPVAFAPAAIKTAWSTAPFIKATGEYVGMLGREAAKARGQIGFWKRVYNMPNQGFTQNMIAGLADTATLGGNLTGLGVRTGKGVLSSIPADLAFNYVAEGGNMDMGSINQALAESVFFGGTGAALGGITMGSKNRIRSLQNGDALNFYRSIADPNQRVIFNGMSGDLKRAIGTFSASYPGSQILFSNEGAGSYDRNTKMLVINPNSRNPLKPLLTHEFLHHILNNGTGDAIVANLVGDGYQTGGILRNKDGSYDAQYEQFKTEYVNDLRRQHERNVKLKDAIGDPMTKAERTFQVPDEKYLAEEYFIENNVDDMLGLVESGKLGKMAGRMIISDKMRSLGDAIINKSAVLKDLHFRLGGMMDSNGKMVVGNGFLGGQLYQSPEIRRMFKRMVNESVGRKAGVDAAKNKARNGIEIQVTGKRDPILYSLDSLWESDGDNPLQDKNGDLVPLKKETEELRSTAGLLLIDDHEKRRASGDTFEPGELAYNPENNTWSGSFLTDNQIKLLKLSGRFSNVQIKQLELLNSAAKTNSDPNAAAGTRGNRFSMFYQPALKKNRKGQWRYDQIKPQLRDVVPYGIEISKDGNILIRIMSTNQLFANATEKAATKRGRLLYQGNIDAILTDANAMIDAHGKESKPESSDRHFKEKYGSQWEEHKKFINSVFGNVGAGHKDINPLVSSDRVDAVVKSYRLDRINKSTQLVGSTKIPYQNNLIKINYLPEGEPILDANGEPKDLRYTPRYEERMPEQRQIPEVSPEDLNPVANEQEAQGLWADGKRMFALNEMDEKLTPITSKAMLDSYSADAIGWMEPEQAPAPSQRFMPEKLDADYMKAVDSGDVGEQERLVDEAARKAGLNIKPIYRGRRSASGNIRSNVPYFTFNEPAAQAYAQEYGGDEGVVLKAYSKFKNTATEKQVVDVAKRINHQFVDEAFPSAYLDVSPKLVKALKEEGFDSVEGRDSLPEDQGTISVVAALYPESQIKSADPITRDDSGNIIPLSKRFDITSKDLRFMPEPLPANYQSSRDTTFLYQSIGPDGIINLTRPLKSTEALPTISTRHEYPMEEFTVSKFDKRASILYTKNKNGEGVAFKFDPQLMKKPEFANFDDLYDGAVVQLAMADRHGATDGDMGGHAFPDLKVNQDILVDDGNGKQYKLVWSNNAWGPVKNMSTKAQKYGATTLLTYNMDPHAHDSNTRTVHIFSNEIANSNLSAKDQSTLLIVMNVALKKAQSSASKQDLRAFLKDKKDIVDTLKKDDKIKAKSPNGDAGLGVAEREALLLSLDDIQKQIDDENQFLKESLGAKLAGDEEVKVDSLFRNYQNKRRAYEKNTKSESRKKAMVDAENELKAYQKTKEFKKAEGLLPSRELDKFSNTFKGRKSLILAVKNKEASVKWHGFDSQKISQAIGDQLNGDSLHIVSSVELSSDPDFKAVYLGDDPREIARMSPQEQQAAQQLKSNPDFVPHEAYLWSMLGPAESKHIYNTNQRSVLESFPDFVNEYSQLPVKPGKLKLNDPNSKASEFNIVNTIRDQSKIKIVFRAKQGRSD